MSNSVEHDFLSDEITRVLDEFSKTKLYSYKEAERRKFDFACFLENSWKRQVVGQTLWKHVEGIDKDIRSMITDDESDVWAYIVRDNIKNRNLFFEIVQDYKRSEYKDKLYKLKTFWIPADFDADIDISRESITNYLQSQVVDDLLFNVVLGNLNANDIKYFVGTTGTVGLLFATLHAIATIGFINYPQLSKFLNVSPGPLRERIIQLTGIGLIWNPSRGSIYYVTQKGRVFLSLINSLVNEINTVDELSYEMKYILEKLGMKQSNLSKEELISHVGWSDEFTFSKLLFDVTYACDNWMIDLGNLNFITNDAEMNPKFRVFM